MNNSKNNAGWIVGGICLLLSVLAAIGFLFYHNEQDRRRMERWRHYDDKYLDD